MVQVSRCAEPAILLVSKVKNVECFGKRHKREINLTNDLEIGCLEFNEIDVRASASAVTLPCRVTA